MASSRKLINKKYISILASIVITAALGFIVFKYYPVFLDNDDVGIKNLLSGQYSGSPEAHVYFILYPISWLLKLGYTLFPTKNVYVWMLIFANYGSLALILYKILYKSKMFITGSLLSVVLVAFFSRFFIYPNWTTTACILAAAALIWFGTIEKKRHIPVFDWIITAVLLVAAYNIRDSVVVMVIPFFGLNLLYKIYFYGKKKYIRELIGSIIVFILMIALCLGCKVIHKSVYSTQEWQEASDFMNYRSMLNDRHGFPEYESNKEYYEKAGIDKATYECLSNDYDYMLATTGRVSANQLKVIAVRAKELYMTGNKDLLVSPKLPGSVAEVYASADNSIDRAKQSLLASFKYILSESYEIYSVILLAVFIMIAIYCIRHRKIVILLDAVFAIGGFILLWVYLIFTGRVTSHVVYSLYMTAYIYLVNIVLDARILIKNKKPAAWFGIYLTTAIILVICASKLVTANKDGYRNVKIAQIKNLVFDYCAEHPENVYIRDILSLNFFELLQDENWMKSANVLPYVTWMTEFPIECKYLPISAGSGNLCEWLKGKNNIYYLVSAERSEECLERKYALFDAQGLKCTLKKSDEITADNGYTIYIYEMNVADAPAERKTGTDAAAETEDTKQAEALTDTDIVDETQNEAEYENLF